MTFYKQKESKGRTQSYMTEKIVKKAEKGR